MRFTELTVEAAKVGIEEYKKSAYYHYHKPDHNVIDEIIENMIDFNDDGTIFGEYRICSHCGKDMTSGYMIYEGEYYYCSDECLYANMSHDEYMELYEEDDAYYTEWY